MRHCQGDDRLYHATAHEFELTTRDVELVEHNGKDPSVYRKHNIQLSAAVREWLLQQGVVYNTADGWSTVVLLIDRDDHAMLFKLAWGT